ncbi:MAG TPA: site-specific integrase [Polyangiaceae bacterium]|nr:site-specific integrase [Polyangiaceae bacterium]
MKSKSEWRRQWGTWIRPSGIKGIYERKDGGFLVRRSLPRPLKPIRKVLPEATLSDAIEWLERETRDRRAGHSPQSQRPLFSAYAASLMQDKIDAGDLKSPASRNKWKYTLEHVIAGTWDEDREHLLVTGFGDLRIGEISVARVRAWRAACGKIVQQGLYDPTTFNQSWRPIFRAITAQAAREFNVPDVGLDLRPLDEDDKPDFTEEDPNALTEEEFGRFLSELKASFPQHYAMALLAFATGLRPSTLRPLRRTGPDRDILWDDGVLMVRRSQTVGDPINKPKKGSRQRIPLPPEVMGVLRWHVETQLAHPAQVASDLLFPNTKGGYRTNSVFRKPFDVVLVATGIFRRFTAKGMRRTFNDITRQAGIRDIVIRAISGHSGPGIQARYATVGVAERRQAVATVIDLAKRRAPNAEPPVPPKDKTEPVPGGRRDEAAREA